MTEETTPTIPLSLIKKFHTDLKEDMEEIAANANRIGSNLTDEERDGLRSQVGLLYDQVKKLEQIIGEYYLKIDIYGN